MVCRGCERFMLHPKTASCEGLAHSPAGHAPDKIMQQHTHGTYMHPTVAMVEEPRQ